MLIDRRKHQLEHTGFLKSLRKRQQYGWLRLVLFFLILFNFFNVSCVENIVFKINAHCFTARSAMSCMCSNFLDTRFTHTVHNSWSAPWLHHLTHILKYIAVIKRHWDLSLSLWPWSVHEGRQTGRRPWKRWRTACDVFFGKQDKNRKRNYTDVETYEIVGKKKTLLKLSIYKVKYVINMINNYILNCPRLNEVDIQCCRHS